MSLAGHLRTKILTTYELDRILIDLEFPVKFRERRKENYSVSREIRIQCPV